MHLLINCALVHAILTTPTDFLFLHLFAKESIQISQDVMLIWCNKNWYWIRFLVFVCKCNGSSVFWETVYVGIRACSVMESYIDYDEYLSWI